MLGVLEILNTGGMQSLNSDVSLSSDNCGVIGGVTCVDEATGGVPCADELTGGVPCADEATGGVPCDDEATGGVPCDDVDCVGSAV